MSKAEEIANRLLQGRGYVVLARTVDAAVPSIPEVIQGTRGCEETGGEGLNHQMVIVAATDKADWHAQRVFLGLELDIIPRGAHFYRAIAE